jgi:hypothetical protein
VAHHITKKVRDVQNIAEHDFGVLGTHVALRGVADDAAHLELDFPSSLHGVCGFGGCVGSAGHLRGEKCEGCEPVAVCGDVGVGVEGPDPVGVVGGSCGGHFVCWQWGFVVARWLMRVGLCIEM